MVRKLCWARFANTTLGSRSLPAHTRHKAGQSSSSPLRKSLAAASRRTTCPRAAKFIATGFFKRAEIVRGGDSFAVKLQQGLSKMALGVWNMLVPCLEARGRNVQTALVDFRRESRGALTGLVMHVACCSCLWRATASQLHCYSGKCSPPLPCLVKSLWRRSCCNQIAFQRQAMAATLMAIVGTE